MRSPRHLLAAAIAATVLATTARAQTAAPPTFDLERLMLDPAARDSLVVGTGNIGPAGSSRVSLTAHWERRPLVVLDTGDFRGRGIGANGNVAQDLVKDRFTLHFGVAYSILDRLEFHAMLPFFWQNRAAGGPAPGPEGTVKRVGFGMPSLGLKLALLQQAAGAPLNVAVAGDVLLPWGTQEAYGSPTDVAFTPRLEIGRRIDKIAVGASGGGLFRANDITFGSRNLRHEIFAGAVLAYIADPLRFEVSGRGTFNTRGLGQNVETLAGVRCLLGGFEVSLLGGPGFGESPGTPTWRGLFALAINTEGERAAPAPAAAPPPPPPPPAAPPAAPPPPAPRDPCAAGEAHSPEQCPDLDDDGDGVPNGRDRCPTVKGAPENEGCPDTDRDGDGIPDRLDACPDQPGIPEFKGCAPPAKAELKQGKIEIKDKVFFDTGKATIQERSHSLLDDVAKVMQAHPEVQHVVIEGHTDNTGAASFNKTLSAARAAAVRNYLVSRGVEAGRLEAKGLGASRPTQPNTTAKGREANRRVEFIVGEVSTQ
ncbi:MAG: OmpA family protein [Anaeromyxobacteraceae bacterium]